LGDKCVLEGKMVISILENKNHPTIYSKREININVLYDLYSSLNETNNVVIGTLANEYKNVTKG
jgi:hypothetical protein